MLPDSYFLPKSMICCARLIVKLLLQYIITFIILNKTRVANFYSTYVINKTLVAHQGLWPSGRGKVSLPLSPGFEPQRARLSPPRCLTCLLGLQGVQWVRELVVVRVSWLGHPGLPKKKKNPCSKLLLNITLHLSYYL